MGSFPILLLRHPGIIVYIPDGAVSRTGFVGNLWLLTPKKLQKRNKLDRVLRWAFCVKDRALVVTARRVPDCCAEPVDRPKSFPNSFEEKLRNAGGAVRTVWCRSDEDFSQRHR